MFRPLGIGEIFDRAITIYTRNFVVFTLMVFTLFAPFAIVQMVATPSQTPSLAQAIDQIEHPAKIPQKHADPTPEYTPVQLTILGVGALLLILCVPFVYNAVAVGVAAVYLGKAPDYRASFGTVMRRWPSVLGVAVVTLLVMVGAYLVSLAGSLLVFALGIALLRPIVVLGVLLIIVAVLLMLAVFVLLMLLIVFYAFALYSVSLEHFGVRFAIASAFERLFNKAEIGKALLIALAYIALELGVLTLSSILGVGLLLIFRSTIALAAVDAVISSVLTAFVTILVAVYYYDVRTRREGLDLEEELQSLGA